MSPLRTTREVFEDHLALRAQGKTDVDIDRNYADDVVLLTLDGIFHGHAGVRHCAGVLEACIGEAAFQYVLTRVHGEVAYLHWAARSDSVTVCDGVDTFVIRNGRIRTKTIYYRVRRGEADPR